MQKSILNKPYMLLTIFSMLTVFNSIASNFQNVQNSKVTESFKVSGNCGMCKKNIEAAANKKGVSKSDWNVDTKIVSITYNNQKTNSSEILKRIALAGYDNEKYLAPEDVYNKLHECCKYERKKTVAVKTIQQPKNETAIQDTVKKEEVNPLLEVYTAYFDLKDALVKNDGITASNKAKELFKAIDKVSMNKLSASQHTVWMKYMTKLSYDAEHIKGVTETDHQREHFSSLSKNMFEVMKAIKPSFPIYYDHCPMYNDGKGGDWISKESVIKNPFYGSQMMSCGKTIETIK